MNQGRRKDQTEFSEKAATFGFIGFLISLIVLILVT
jgi:hypothetical protein